MGWGCVLWLSCTKEVHRMICYITTPHVSNPLIAMMKMNAIIYIFTTQEVWIIKAKINFPILKLIHDPQSGCFHLNSPSSLRVTAFPWFYQSSWTSENLGNQYSWLPVLAPLPCNPASSHFHFSFHEAISFPMGVTEITISFPIVKPINSSMINALAAPNTKLRWLQTKTLEEKKVIVNSPNCNNFYLLNILSQINHFICCSHFLLSLIN